MSINALIAQGSRPIGEGLPEVANMLNQRAQQNLQNSRQATQDSYAADQHSAMMDQESEAKKNQDAKQAVAEVAQLHDVPDDQLAGAIQQMPHVVQAMSQNNIPPDNIPAVRAALDHVGRAAAGYLGITPPAPKYGAPVAGTDATGKPAFARFSENGPGSIPVTGFAPPVKEETFGAPTDLVMGGKPSVAQIGSQGTVRPIAGATPYNKPSVASTAPAGGGLDKDTIHDAAIDVMSDPARIRQYATFGASGQAMRVAINNEKTNILHSVGMTEPQLIRQQAIAKGEIKSTSDLVGMQNAVNAYETLAQGNGQRVIELANAVNTSGIPLINSAERLGKLASGSPDAAELMLVLHNYQVEAARIVTQPSLKGQLTDQAIKDIQTVTPANMTPAQAVRLVSRLNFEFDLRQRGIQGSLDTAGGQITPGFPTGAKPAPGVVSTSAPNRNAKGWTLHTDKNGAKAYVSPDGKQYEMAP